MATQSETGIPHYFRRSASVSANYSWTDLIAGVGYRTYYLCGQNQWSSFGPYIFFVTPRPMDACSDDQAIAIAGLTTNADWTTIIDKDFDLLFNMPAIIYGTAFVNSTVKVWSNSDASPGFAKLTINFYHVSTDAAETLLGTFTTDQMSGISTPSYSRYSIPISLSNKKFAIGEKLRLNVYVEGKIESGKTMYCRIYIDPTSRQTFTDILSTTVGSDFKFDVPFKISI